MSSPFIQSNNLTELQRACLFAVLVHALLVSLLPDIPALKLPSIDRGKTITVFLREEPEEEPFEQTLLNPGEISQRLPETAQAQNPSLVAASGQQEQLQDENQRLDAERDDLLRSTPSGDSAQASVEPRITLSYASIKLFAEQEAYRHAEENPDLLARFKRSFNSSASYRARPDTESFTDLYGSYYVRNHAADGDICFKKEEEPQTDDFSTHMVLFFRCGEQPLKLNLERTETRADP